MSVRFDSNSTLTMAQVEQTLVDEIAFGANQDTVAATYAWAMRNARLGEPVNWIIMNTAIQERWPKGLERVKIKAHKWYKQHFGVDPMEG